MYWGAFNVPLRSREDESRPQSVSTMILPAAGLFQARNNRPAVETCDLPEPGAAQHPHGPMAAFRSLDPISSWRVACKEDKQIAQKGAQSMSEWHNNGEMQRDESNPLLRI
jgi:hypothetical protein